MTIKVEDQTLLRTMGSVRLKAKQAIEAITSLPPLRAAERWAYERTFAGNAPGAFRGVFPSFGEAVASAPQTRPLGYDNPQAAALWAERPIFAEDYAVLFWLKSLAQPGFRMFDYGGHTGAVYDAFARVLQLPDGFDWNIYDVPAVVEEGRKISLVRHRPHVRFTTEFGDAAGVDVLLASGSLQYVDIPFHERLVALERRPMHIIVNQLPLHDELEFVTLQSIGTAFCPYRVFHRRRFVDSLESIGYETVDSWSNRCKKCRIPTYPQHAVEHYSGAYFRLRRG